MSASLDRFLRKAEVLQLTSLSYPTIWRMVRADLFPKPVSISPGRVAWRQSEIQKWIADRVALGGAK